MRKLRIAQAAQLSLAIEEEPTSFWDLPEKTQARVLRLMAHMIAKGVVDDEEGKDG